MEKKIVKQEGRPNYCLLCGGDTILQKQANFLLWCEIQDGNTACEICTECGNIEMLSK